MTLAIDFDGTIVEDKYPQIGELKPGAREVINDLYCKGNFIIIWTSRTDERREAARKFLIDNSIMFHTINESNPANVKQYGGDTRKVAADIYIDDKSLYPLPEWKLIQQHIFSYFTFNSNI